VDIDNLRDKTHTDIVIHAAWTPEILGQSKVEDNMPPKQYDASSVRKAMVFLNRTTGLQTQILAQADTGHDESVRITTDAGQSFDLHYAVKTTIDRRDQLVTFKTLHGDALLITRSLSSAMSELCRELNIQFIDHAGNCYLRQPGLFVMVSGSKDPTKGKVAATRGLTPAALRVVLAVLTLPSILNSNIRRIAEVAAISHGAAGAALIMLEELGLLITSARTGRRLLVMPERWLDAWTEGYLGRIRPKLEKHKMSAPVPIPAVLERVLPQMHEVALGGEAAAAYRNMGLKPGALTLYIDLDNLSVMRNLVQELKLRRDPEGKIELVNIFWNTKELHCFPTVPDALIYADLVGTGDGRTMEIATSLRKEICSYVTSES
jgi:hypothetical protein